MRVISGAVLLILACILQGTISTAFPGGGPWKIGVLWDVKETPARFVPLLEWFREDLKAQGFDDKDLQFEVRQVEGTGPVPEAARELLRAHVDVIWTSTDVPARAAKAEVRETPIVFGISADPIKIGLVPQLARPGGNITGVAIHSHVNGKRLELLKALVPHARRVLVTPNPDLEDTKWWLEELREASKRLNVTIVDHPVTSKTDVERWPETFRTERIDAVLHLVNANVNQNWEIGIRALQAARMPDMSYYLPAVQNHWVMAAYAVPHREAWRMSARLVARILRGAKPQDLPVESADVFELHVNRGVAKERGVQIPESILRRADKLFE